MNVETILKSKGRAVHTVAPTAAIAEAVRRLAELRIGALVVSGDSRTILGIISERDIVRGLAQHGAALMSRSVAELMTRSVVTCRPNDLDETVLSMMTEHRMRHVPVVADGELYGLVSIGDVVKSRLDDVVNEAEAMREYIARA
jgi:CBS domain-containing protein